MEILFIGCRHDFRSMRIPVENGRENLIFTLFFLNKITSVVQIQLKITLLQPAKK